MQRSRRANPYPFTWEIPLAVAVAVLLALTLAAHVGRGVANVFAGGDFIWPARSELVTSVIGVLQGDPSAGLAVGTPAAASVSAVLLSVAVAEMMTVGALVWAGAAVLSRWGPGRLRGMATRDEAEQHLGLSRLRKVRAVIRPDLYGTEPR